MPQLRLKQVAEALAELFFPPTCTFCGNSDPYDRRLNLCAECYEKLRPIPEPICICCGLPLEAKAAPGAELCGACLTTPLSYAQARFGYFYEGDLRDALVSFKYYQRLDVIGTLGELTIRAFHRYFDASAFDIVVPVPLSKKRLRERGFNQSTLIARRLSERMSIPLDYSSLRKMRDTKPQARLTRKQRKINLKGSFDVKSPESVSGSRILLIDDVSTTQATIGEAARTLMKAKAACVECLALALTSPATRAYSSDESNEPF